PPSGRARWTASSRRGRRSRREPAARARRAVRGAYQGWVAGACRSSSAWAAAAWARMPAVSVGGSCLWSWQAAGAAKARIAMMVVFMSSPASSGGLHGVAAESGHEAFGHGALAALGAGHQGSLLVEELGVGARGAARLP